MKEWRCFSSRKYSKKEYNEMKKIIKNDFERLLILFDDYEDNKELIGELKNVIKNICDNEITSFCVNDRIDLLPDYLCFDYIDPNGFRTCENFDYISVIMNRNAREFYFVYRLDPSFGTIIKEFNIKDKKIIHNEYKDYFASSIFDDYIYLHSDILKLKKLERLN